MSTPPWTLAGYSNAPEPSTGVNRIAYNEPLTPKPRSLTVRVLVQGVWVDSWGESEFVPMKVQPRAPHHGPWHRDAKHVARLLAQWRDVVRERMRTRGTVHEGVLVTG